MESQPQTICECTNTKNMKDTINRIIDTDISVAAIRAIVATTALM